MRTNYMRAELRNYRPLVIYHANCVDGFAAAWAVRRHFGTADTHAANYGEPPPCITPGQDVIIVDFSYPVDVLEEIARVTNVLVLDHHKTAAKDLEALMSVGSWGEFIALCERRESDRSGRPHALRAVFDMERSGAGLAWDFFNPGKPRPTIIDRVEDRDLWRFKWDTTRPLHSYLTSFEFDFEKWDMWAARINLASTEPGMHMDAIREGEAIDRMHLQKVRELIKDAWEIEIAGHTVPCINLPYHMMSDGIGMLAEGKPFAAGYYDTKAGRKWSLRSRADGLDVSEIAKKFGGGGHRNAAGFETNGAATGFLFPRRPE